jgi:hypothetical protein
MFFSFGPFTCDCFVKIMFLAHGLLVRSCGIVVKEFVVDKVSLVAVIGKCPTSIVSLLYLTTILSYLTQ